MSAQNNLLIVGVSQAAFWILILGLVAFAIKQARQRRKTWRDFAMSRGLTPPGEKMSDALKISGSQQGLPFTLDVETRGSGKNKSHYTRCRVDLTRELPQGLVISKEGFLSGIGKMLGAQDIQTEDADFDKEAIIKGANPEEVTRYLRHPGVREAVLKVVQAGSGSRIEKNQVRLYRHGMVDKEDQLEQLLAHAIEAASALNRG
jgi:hypothetical protein